MVYFQKSFIFEFFEEHAFYKNTSKLNQVMLDSFSLSHKVANTGKFILVQVQLVKIECAIEMA